MSDEAEQHGMRRTPRQTRGQQRVAAIVAAAGELFAEVGYEAATTNAIAERAGVPIGSVYQFFPNKAAILHALTLRQLEELRELYGRVLGDDAAQLAPELALGRLVDAMVEFQGSHPGFMTAFGGAELSPEVAAASAELNQELLGRVEALLAGFVPELPRAQLPLHALVSIYTVKGMLLLLDQVDPPLRPGVVAELKSLLLGYLQTLRARVSVR